MGNRRPLAARTHLTLTQETFCGNRVLTVPKTTGDLTEPTVVRRGPLRTIKLFPFDDVVSVVSQKENARSTLRWLLRTSDHELTIIGDEHMIALLENGFARWVKLHNFLSQVLTNSRFSEEAQKILSEKD